MRASCWLPLFALFVGFAGGTTSHRAFAEDDSARASARALAQEGAELFEKDDFRGALDKFKQAYERFPSPKLFLNLGQALRGLGKNAEAFVAFERFLAEAPDANPDYREQAATQLAELGGKLARVLVACNRPGASVAVDGEKKGELPLPRPVLVEPGPHHLTVTWEGETKSVAFTSVAGQDSSHSVTFEDRKPLAAAAPIVSPSPLLAVPAAAAVQPVPPAPFVTAPAPRQPENSEVAPDRASHVWYWIAGGVVVAGVATTLAIVYGRRNSYPTADLGARAIGGSP